MVRSIPHILGDFAAAPPPESRQWAQSHGTYIAGRAYLDEADQTAAEMEAKWGSDRLRLLVSPELREKFDRQRYLLNQAIWLGELEAVRCESARMVKAWLALDGAASAAGKAKLSPLVWEVAVPVVAGADNHYRAGADNDRSTGTMTGTKAGADNPVGPDNPACDHYVAAIVPSSEHAKSVMAEGRNVVVFTLEEIARLLAAMPALAKTKTLFPGAAVTSVRKSVDDPLLSIHDMDEPLDDLEFAS